MVNYTAYYTLCNTRTRYYVTIVAMAKPSEKTTARIMRVNGESIKVIARKLAVSPASVSTWCRDIVLTSHQISQLELRYKDPHYGRRQIYLNKIKKTKETKIKQLKEEGIKDIGMLTDRDLFLVGISLYWSEGFKKDSQAGFANSDPKMIKLFLRWLLETCNYDRKDLILRVTANVSHKYRINEIEKYWSDITEIPVTQFRKPFFQNVTWKKEYERPEEYNGVLRIRVRKSTDFLRKIHGWIEGLKIQA